MHFPQERLTVGEENRIRFADARMPAVLATPWLVAHLEYAGRRAIADCLRWSGASPLW